MFKKNITRYFLKTLACLFCALLFSSCKPGTDSVSKVLLGTVVTITIDADENISSQAMIAAFDEVERIEKLFSIYKPDSEVSAVNANAYKKPVKVRREILDLIRNSLEVSEKTWGAFDITFASMGKMWDFSRDNFIPPDPGAIRRIMPAFSYRNIRISDRDGTIRFLNRGTKIGLGGIAKGYAVRRAVNVLKGRNIRNAIVACAGDIQVIGSRQGRLWLAGIKHPRDDSIIGSIKLYDGDSVSTSGDYERFRFYNGMRYHHIIDPATGYPSGSGLISVTVVSPDPVWTDAYSTSFFIMGLEKTRKFLASRNDLAAVLITEDLRIFVSQSLRGSTDFPAVYSVSYF